MENNQHERNRIKQLKEEIDRLPIEEKVRLIQEVLTTNGLQVVMGGGNFISAEIVLQIQSGDVDLEKIFQAAANRISRERESGNLAE